MSASEHAKGQSALRSVLNDPGRLERVPDTHWAPIDTPSVLCTRRLSASAIFMPVPQSSSWDAKSAWKVVCRVMRFDTQILLAIPIFIAVGLLVCLEGLFYIGVRFTGRMVEKFVTRPGMRHLIHRMNKAEDFTTYAKCAETLDRVTGRNRWKADFDSPPVSTYDPALIRRRLRQLQFNETDIDHEKVYGILKAILETQLQDTFHPALYSMTYAGTKYKIEEFHASVIRAIKLLSRSLHRSSEICNNRSFIRKVSTLYKTFGLTALVFSGGAMLGLHHLGLLEVLVEMSILPKIISGTSAGSIVAAFACSRTDQEILEFLRDPEQLKVFREPFDPNNHLLRLLNFCKYGYTVRAEPWLESAKQLFGTMTFLEAYSITGGCCYGLPCDLSCFSCPGRVLNITMSRANEVESPIVLNYRNAANVLLATAVLASSAFPYLGFPTHLLEKDPDSGTLHQSKTYYQRFYCDGSLREDVPCDYLRSQWGVRYIIVSQVNPHVFPFLDLRSHGLPGQPVRGWGSAAVWRGGFPLAVLEVALKEHLRYLLRVLALLEILPSVNGINISYVALQKYGGDLNISPSRFYWPHLGLMNNVSHRGLQWYMQTGRRMTFPKIWLLRTRINIEKALHLLKAKAHYAARNHLS